MDRKTNREKIEKIGYKGCDLLDYDIEIKPEFNTDWYKNVDSYSEGNIEDTIIRLILENKDDDYSKTIAENFGWSVYYHLSHVRANLLNWYPFSENSSVLEIGCGMGAVTDLLCGRCGRVTAVELSKKRATAAALRCRHRENLEIIVGNLNDIEFREKYDYITLIGVLEYQNAFTDSANPFADFLTKIKSLLKPGGRLLIAIENKYGLKYWCGAVEDHTGLPFDGINQYQIGDHAARTFSKEELSRLITESGFGASHFYYPLPDYKLPTVIFSENFLPREGQDDGMEYMDPYYIPHAGTLVADERTLYPDLIRNGVFEFFANSFLVECSDEAEGLGEVCFAALNCFRKKDYRIGTLIRKNGRVEKYSLTGHPGGVRHIHQTCTNMIKLQKQGLHTLPFLFENNRMTVSYNQNPTLAELLAEAYRSKNAPLIWACYDKLLKELSSSSPCVPAEENILFETGIDSPENGISYGPILEMGYLDLTPRNCFVNEGEFYWFDQEWKIDKVPLRFLFYRAIKYTYGSYPWMEKTLPINSVLEHYKIQDCTGKFEELENAFLSTVLDQETGICAQFLSNIPSGIYQSNIEKLCHTAQQQPAEKETVEKTVTLPDPPEITLICVDCTDEAIDSQVAMLAYPRLNVVKATSGPDLLPDILQFSREAESKYICFLEPGQHIEADKLERMAKYMEENAIIEGVICRRDYCADGEPVAGADWQSREIFSHRRADGTSLLEYSIANNINLYGNLSTLMIRTQVIPGKLADLEDIPGTSHIRTVVLNWLLVYDTSLYMIPDVLVHTELQPMDEELFIQDKMEFISFINHLKSARMIERRDFPAPVPDVPEDIEKKITFFYTDRGEYLNLEPVAKEAARRGYEVNFTKDINEKAEIGVYCQHYSQPENSKFSVVLLHDMAQGHNRWPDFWNAEPWNRYDMGILPGNDWAERWKTSAAFYYANPKRGAFLFGYPKSDYAESAEFLEDARRRRDELGLIYDTTILYAPSWEYGDKEEDFIRALASLKVNLLIKQSDWPPFYSDIIKNIHDMRQRHEGKYENVYYMEMTDNIWLALKMCDLVVSDESSVMTEALMFGIPSIAVTDWLIPDKTPPRPASVPFDYVHKCKKVELREYVERILSGDMAALDIEQMRKDHFCNAGHCCEDILDAIEHFTQGGEASDFKKSPLETKYMPVTFWN